MVNDVQGGKLGFEKIKNTMIMQTGGMLCIIE